MKNSPSSISSACPLPRIRRVGLSCKWPRTRTKQRRSIRTVPLSASSRVLFKSYRASRAMRRQRCRAQEETSQQTFSSTYTSNSTTEFLKWSIARRRRGYREERLPLNAINSCYREYTNTQWWTISGRSCQWPYSRTRYLRTMSRSWLRHYQKA